MMGAKRPSAREAMNQHLSGYVADSVSLSVGLGLVAAGALDPEPISKVELFHEGLTRVAVSSVALSLRIAGRHDDADKASKVGSLASLWSLPFAISDQVFYTEKTLGLPVFETAGNALAFTRSAYELGQIAEQERQLSSAVSTYNAVAQKTVDAGSAAKQIAEGSREGKATSTAKPNSGSLSSDRERKVERLSGELKTWVSHLGSERPPMPLDAPRGWERGASNRA